MKSRGENEKMTTKVFFYLEAYYNIKRCVSTPLSFIYGLMSVTPVNLYQVNNAHFGFLSPPIGWDLSIVFALGVSFKFK